jgi:hypothetical protein
MSLSKQVTRPLFKLAVLKRFKQQKPLPFEGARTFCTCAVIQSCHFFCLCQGGRRSGGPRSGDASSFEGAELEALAALQGSAPENGGPPSRRAGNNAGSRLPSKKRQRRFDCLC